MINEKVTVNFCVHYLLQNIIVKEKSMQKLIFKFWNKSNYYNFIADIDENKVSYKVKSKNFSENKEGMLDVSSTKEFVEKLKKAEIENWLGIYYKDESTIMDVGQFNLCYVDDNANIFFTVGVEGCQPKEYEYMIRALAVCDANARNLSIFD